MVLRILVFVLIIILIGCNTNTKSVDYFGQPEPESTPVLFAEGIISVKGRLEHGITFTPSARELAFGVLNKESFKGEIHYSKKTNGKWTSPGIFKPLENNSVFLPYFSPDGKSLVYTQSKWDSALHFKDLWMIEKNNGMWCNPEKMKIPLPSLASVSNACLSLDRTLYFSSNINCIGKENCHTADLFYSNIINN
ncbi:MAG: hypothetical protein MI922_07835 [Bacteroidales bacterium]|nr:hypothetical protein [Bacteroidales bacterium]